MSEETGKQAAAWTPAAKRLGNRLLQGLDQRLELLGIELGEERDRLVRIAALFGGLIIFAFSLLLWLSVLVLVWFWEDRGWVVLGLVGLYLVGALAIAWLLRREMRAADQPFETTIEVLRRDQTAFRSER